MKSSRRRNVKIALCQTPFKEGGRERNADIAESYVVRAAKRGADLVVLPECFIDFARLYAEPVPSGPISRRFGALAAKLKVHLVMGTVGEKSRGKVYNTAALFDDRGRLVGRYRKRFLWWTERAEVAPGRKAPVFKTRLGRIGLAVCWDLAFPEHFRELALAGAEIAACPAYWQAGDRFGRLGPKRGRRAAPLTSAEDFFVNSCVPARAAENSLAMAFCNAAGRTRPQGRPDWLVGLSQVAVPLAGVLKRAGQKPDIVVADVDLDLVGDAERIYGTRHDVARTRKRRPRA